MAKDHEHDEKKGKSHGHGGGGHGGGAHEEDEGAPEWLISFADNVTLMMGFFVILLAMNLKPAATGGAGTSKEPGHAESTPEMLDAAIAIREAFNNPIDLGSQDPQDMPLVKRVRYLRGESDATSEGAKGRDKDVRSIRPSDYFGKASLVEFSENAQELTPQAVKTLDDFAKQIAGLNLVVEIRGHTSSIESVDRPEQAMKLAHERAMEVADHLVEHGVRWTQLRLIASADNERAVPTAYDRERHRANQRVEVIVTDQVMKDYHVPSEK